MKKLVLTIVLVFALAIPALANPFVDVPSNHWAYDAVQTLEAKGVVIGYPDGTFGGDRTLTRYEFAEATARMLAYFEDEYEALAEDVEILSKLSIEFADELASLGVTVADLEAALGEQSEAIEEMQEKVDKHERFFEPVTISGTWSADYEYTVIGDEDTPAGTAELTDSADLTFSAEINPETTAALSMEVDDVLSGSPTVDFSGYDLKYMGDWSLWVSDEVEPDTIGLGLIYDSADFPGAWAQWNWDADDEDLGTWTMFMDVDDFYVLNVGFNLGDDDDIPMGITASYDQAAGNVFVGGADIAFNLNDEDDDDVSLALEGGVLSDMATTSFGAATKLSATFGDDDDVDAYVKGWYLQPGFVPTNSDYDADELGVEVGLDFTLTEEDDDQQITAGPYWGYAMDSAMTAPSDHFVGLDLDFTDFDEDHPDTTGMASVEYSILTGVFELAAGINDLYLSEDDDLIMNAKGDYVFGTPGNYDLAANVIYKFDDDKDLIVEGRLDSDGAAFYSAEAQLVFNMAENTDLHLGVEMNDWEDDINDFDEMNILDTTTKIYGGVEVSF